MNEVYNRRYEITKPYLKGVGLEIGPGIFPQEVPNAAQTLCFDVRSRPELSTLFNVPLEQTPEVYPLDTIATQFPEGADFLIAHHVIEHCSNPIAVLIEWVNYLKPGGVLVVSAPYHSATHDKGRTVPSLDHILMDYLFDRGDTSFESLEHIFSFTHAWRDAGHAKTLDKHGVANWAFSAAQSKKNDLHWHAFNYFLLEQIIWVASLLSRRCVRVLSNLNPAFEGKGAEALLCYQLETLDRSQCVPPEAVVEELRGAHSRIQRALKRLNTFSISG